MSESISKSSSSTIFCPGVNDGNPLYGHPLHLNASPRLQEPHEESTPGFSSISNVNFLVTVPSSSALPHVQPLHALFVVPISQSSTFLGFTRSLSSRSDSSSINFTLSPLASLDQSAFLFFLSD